MVVDEVDPMLVIGNREVRDFERRILHPLCMRLGDGQDDVDVGMEWSSSPDSSLETRTLFTLQHDNDDEAKVYDVEFYVRTQLDESWSFDYLQEMYMPKDPTDPTDNEDNEFEDDFFDTMEEIDIEEFGYVLTIHGYTFRVPYAPKRQSTACKKASINFFDSELEPVGGVLVYGKDLTAGETSVDDVEALLRNGTAVLNTEQAEKGLRVVTTSDLQFILNAFQQVGVVSHRAKVLGAKTFQHLEVS